MMWLRQAVGYGEPEQPRVSPIENNPVGWSSIYPPQVVTNPDPNVSPVVPKATMTPQALWGALLAGKRNQPVTGAELPALEQKANTAVNYGMAVAGATQPIRAFHGSPHTFDRFSLDKIGTGEGAQAYGHGLYFAGNEGVARGYKRNLADGMVARDGTAIPIPRDQNAISAYELLRSHGDDYEKTIAMLKGYRDKSTGALRAEQDAVLDWLDVWRGSGARPAGSMYEVSLRTTPERLLDWDKPLSQQPGAVREALAPGLGRRPADVEAMSRAGVTVNDPFVSRQLNDPEVVDRLRKAGVDGIQYLDAGSRAAGDGTRNYVMFRDDLIDILRRYGLFGLGMMGAAGAKGGREQ